MTRVSKFALSLAIFGMFVVATPLASADTITFNNDPTGQKIGAFQSVDSPIVVFSNPQGTMFLATFVTFQNTSNVLVTEGAGEGVLVMDFSVAVTSLTFEFGHTVPLLPPQLNATGTATLNLFLNGVHVGQTFLATDNNVLVDQIISFSTGQPFDRAVFSVIAHGPANDFGVGEVVDNINFTQVPEPATALLLGTGLAGVLAVIRKRRRSFR